MKKFVIILLLLCTQTALSDIDIGGNWEGTDIYDAMIEHNYGGGSYVGLSWDSSGTEVMVAAWLDYSANVAYFGTYTTSGELILAGSPSDTLHSKRRECWHRRLGYREDSTCSAGGTRGAGCR